MKKIRYLIIFLILMFPFTYKASVNCSTPGTVESGESFGVTYYGSIGGAAPIWFMKLGNEGNAYYLSGSLSVEGEETSDFSRTIYFTAGDPGTATFYAYDVDVASDTDSFSDSNSCSVEIVSATRPNNNNETGTYYYDDDEDDNDDTIEESKSNDNSLKKLVVEGYKISPEFNKDTLKYTLVVNGDVDKVTVNAEKNSDSANITGTGEKKLNEGSTKIEVAVTAENGETRIYEITVTKKESDPIEVVIDKKKYTVVKNDLVLKAPDGFVKTKVVINKQEVTAYSNSLTGYLIVTLIDEYGKASWYIYDQKDSTYTKYSEYKSNEVRIVLLKPNKKDIPSNYTKCTFSIEGEEIEGYRIDSSSTYRLVYGLNMKTGNKDFYLYDMDENSFQRFDIKGNNKNTDFIKKLEIIIIGLVSLLLISFILNLYQKSSNKRIKKVLNKKEDNNIKEELPITPEIKKIDIEKEQSKTKKIVNADVKEKTKEIEIPKEDTMNITKEIELTRKERKKREKALKEEMAEERRKFLGE